MSREHIGVRLAFPLLLCLSLHYVSSSPSLRPPSLPEVTRGQGLSKGQKWSERATLVQRSRSADVQTDDSYLGFW